MKSFEHCRNTKEAKKQLQTEESKKKYKELDKKVKNGAEKDWKNCADM